MSEMCSGKATLRTNDKEITVFKAIGQAVTDLVAASLAYSAAQ
jgi:ornithine cyclodeaminase/alanine dehydrogenase-like protein (mu-crystallin family)